MCLILFIMLLGFLMVNFFIKTYGCQANVADSQAIVNYLVDLGANQVEKESLADLILINTCAIRDKAEQKLFSYLGKLAVVKKNKSYIKIGVIGCVASYRQSDIFQAFHFIDFVFGAKKELTELQVILSNLILTLESIKNLENKFVNYDPSIHFALQNTPDYAKASTGTRDERVKNNKFSLTKTDIYLGGLKSNNKELKQSFINIMTGCNNYCSYCIVPFTRGREKSYDLNSILDRVKRDLDSGAKLITLLGQNVNSYKDTLTGANFSELLNKIAQLDGQFWVNFVSPHPKDMTIDVLDVIACNRDKLCDYIHLPLQSGSNRVLELMNRTYTIQEYMEKVGWIKDKLPNSTISTDIIVGFPTETEQEYLETRKVMEEVNYDLIYSFIYSSRKYTKASLLIDNCSKQEKTRRLNELQERQLQISLKQNSLNIGKTLKTLVEKRLANGMLLARTSGNVRIIFKGDDSLISTFVQLKIEKVSPANMFAILI